MWRCSVRRICRQHVRPVPTPRCRSYPRQSRRTGLCRSAPRTWSASARDKWHSLADFTVRPTATASCARVRARLRKSSNSRRAFASSAPTTRYVESINCAITASTARSVPGTSSRRRPTPAGSGPVTVPTATTVSGPANRKSSAARNAGSPPPISAWTRWDWRRRVLSTRSRSEAILSATTDTRGTKYRFLCGRRCSGQCDPDRADGVIVLANCDNQSRRDRGVFEVDVDGIALSVKPIEYSCIGE